MPPNRKHREGKQISPFYNQFILGPRPVEGLFGWQQFQLWDTYYLMAHPSLSVEKAENEKAAAYLIGYMLDPEYPHAKASADILKSLIDRASEGMDIFEAIEPLGGRWVLIFKTPQTLKLVHDAAGLRQVYYTDVGQTGELWCASQPKHIARACALNMDQEAVDFIKWFQDKNAEFWWPGDSSPYSSIKRLLPNHYLDLKSGQFSRFWPKQNRESRPLDEAVTEISETLTRMMQSAAARFDLAVAMSAGWDSRLMLAACKPIARKLRYYTIKLPPMEMTHTDIEIPTKLLAKLGLAHDLIETRTPVSPQFGDIFNQQVPFAHQKTKAPMYTILNYYNRQRVGATGNVSEVARCYYRRPDPPTQAATTEYLVEVTGVDHPFARKQFGRWLQAMENWQQYSYLDLFQWEEKHGSWLAQKYLEFDTAWSDIFTPYNNRKLLMNMLAVDECHRRRPSYTLYKHLIMKMWPVLLSYPINPKKQPPKGLINNLKRLVKPLKRFSRG